MAALSFHIGFLLALTPLALTQTSFLQRRGRQGARGRDDEDLKLCTFGAEGGLDNLINVFAAESENTRYVSFASATDDGFIESMQRCKGELPEICGHENASSTPKGCATCPCTLDLDHEPFGNYQRRMLEFLQPLCQAPRKNAGKDPFRVLLVGLGGGALVQYILGQCPQGTVVEAIEYDARMIEVATRFFGLHPSPGTFHVEQGDGGAVVAAHAAKGKIFDMVLVDAFAGGSHVPASCRDAAFTGNVRRILRKGGSVLANMAGPTYRNLAGTDDWKTTLPLYKESFGSSSVTLEELRGNMEFPSRLIVAQVPP